MTPILALYSILSTNFGVTAIAGALPNTRIYPAGNLPQEEVLAAITFQTIAGMPANTMTDRAPADHERIQVDCWSSDYNQAISLGDAVRTALEDATAMITAGVGIQCISLNGQDYESDTERYRVSFDFSIWAAR